MLPNSPYPMPGMKYFPGAVIMALEVSPSSVGEHQARYLILTSNQLTESENGATNRKGSKADT